MGDNGPEEGRHWMRWAFLIVNLVNLANQPAKAESWTAFPYSSTQSYLITITSWSGMDLI